MGRGKGKGGDLDTSTLLGLGCIVGVITSIVLIACSFSRVDETEACLTVNAITGVVGEEVTSEPGNYFTGVDKGFTCFTKSLQRLDFRGGNAVWARTSEGLAVKLEFSIEYQLDAAQLRDLLLAFPVVPNTDKASDDEAADEEKSGEGDDPSTRYSTSYRAFYRNVVLAELRHVAATYTAEKLIGKEKGNLMRDLELRLEARLKDHALQSASVLELKADLPDKFEQGLLAIQKLAEKQKVREAARSKALEDESVSRQNVLETLKKERETSLKKERGKADAEATTRKKKEADVDADRSKREKKAQEERNTEPVKISQSTFTH